MYTKTISFKDLDGNEIAEEFHFNLNKADMVEMQVSVKGGLHEYIKTITADEDEKAAYEIFKNLVGKSIGKKAEDGRRFLRSQEITDDFMQTDAYSEFLTELLTKADSASEFIRGIFPKEIIDQMVTDEKAPQAERSEAEIIAMSQTDFDAAYGTDPMKWAPAVMMAAYKRKNAA